MNLLNCKMEESILKISDNLFFSITHNNDFKKSLSELCIIVLELSKSYSKFYNNTAIGMDDLMQELYIEFAETVQWKHLRNSKNKKHLLKKCLKILYFKKIDVLRDLHLIAKEGTIKPRPKHIAFSQMEKEDDIAAQIESLEYGNSEADIDLQDLRDVIKNDFIKKLEDQGRRRIKSAYIQRAANVCDIFVWNPGIKKVEIARLLGLPPVTASVFYILNKELKTYHESYNKIFKNMKD